MWCHEGFWTLVGSFSRWLMLGCHCHATVWLIGVGSVFIQTSCYAVSSLSPPPPKKNVLSFLESMGYWLTALTLYCICSIPQLPIIFQINRLPRTIDCMILTFCLVVVYCAVVSRQGWRHFPCTAAFHRFYWSVFQQACNWDRDLGQLSWFIITLLERSCLP